MLLAEELTLVATNPGTGRHQLGTGDQLNACLAGLLVAELLLDGVIGLADKEDRIAMVPGGPMPSSPTLAAAAEVVAEKGPSLKAVLSHMSRGLKQRMGASTWGAAVAGLTEAGMLGPAGEGLVPRQPLRDPGARDNVVSRLQAAAAGEGPIEPRTALVLSMTGPGQLLGVVAPERNIRRHARRRIDHALDGSDLEPVGRVVRKLIRDAQVAATIASA